MGLRNTVYVRTRLSTEATKFLSPRGDGALTVCPVQDKPRVRFHLSISTDKKLRAQQMVTELQKSPLGRLITAIATTPPTTAPKDGAGQKTLQYSASQLEEKLILAMEHVMNELSDSNQCGNTISSKQKNT